MKVKDLTGKRFGSLVALEHYPRVTKCTSAHWLCQCDCGATLVVRSDNLRSGHSTKCSACSDHRGHGSVFVKEVMEDGVV